MSPGHSYRDDDLPDLPDGYEPTGSDGVFGDDDLGEGGLGEDDYLEYDDYYE